MLFHMPKYDLRAVNVDEQLVIPEAAWSQNCLPDVKALNLDRSHSLGFF